MNTFSQRVAQAWAGIKATKQITEIVEQVGADNLKLLVESNVSIVGTFLQHCSPQGKATLRLAVQGLTPEGILKELIGRAPSLGSIIEKRPEYWQGELQKITEFLKGG